MLVGCILQFEAMMLSIMREASVQTIFYLSEQLAVDQ